MLSKFFFRISCRFIKHGSFLLESSDKSIVPWITLTMWATSCFKLLVSDVSHLRAIVESVENSLFWMTEVCSFWIVCVSRFPISTAYNSKRGVESSKGFDRASWVCTITKEYYHTFSIPRFLGIFSIWIENNFFPVYKFFWNSF